MPDAKAIDNTLHPQMTVRLDETGSPLQVKVLAMTLKNRSVVMVALDTAYIQQSSADWLRSEVAAAIGLDRAEVAEIIVQCSHSHSTPFLESIDIPHRYLTQVTVACVEAAKRAWASRRPARIGHAVTHVIGASFNQRVHLPHGRVKFTRDYREGLASGRPIDPRLNVLRVDDEDGRPIAGWVRFAAHPACVIFDAPISAEYPGYMTDQLSQTVAGGAPVLFGFGAAGDVNCIPMFGTEDDARRLGMNLAGIAAPVFEAIETHTPQRLLVGGQSLEIPLDPAPTVKTLDREIDEVDAFLDQLETDPSAVWLLGSNAGVKWTVQKKKDWARPMRQWAERMKTAIEAGQTFPTSWPIQLMACVIDDLGLLFYSGEILTQIGLDIAARSPLAETLAVSHTNGWTGYLGTDEDRRRGGYETANWHRMFKPMKRIRPLPYALGAAETMIHGSLGLFKRILDDDPASPL